MRVIRGMGVITLGLAVALGFAWAFGALYFDGPSKALAVGWAVALVAGCAWIRKWRWRLVLFVSGFVIVLAWWLTLEPSNEANWQADVAEVAWADIAGDVVTLHQVRNFDYRMDSSYTARWETRSVRLSQITGVDLFINYWGSPWMAHPIVSFQFADAPPLCFSIETRKRVGQSYSAVGGLYRQFDLIYIVADERDVIRLRSNFRKGEDVYLYRTRLTPAQARERFLEYVGSINELAAHPRWYHAVTANCTTAIRSQRPREGRMRWDWRLLINGKADELMYVRDAILTDGLSFAELKQRARINPAAQAANADPDFSSRIREGRPGMGSQPGPQADQRVDAQPARE